MNSTLRAGLGLAASIWLISAAGAPARSADGENCASQQPTLLDRYKHRPSWGVAGVDYCVGVPEGLALKNPATISMRGASANARKRIVRVTGDNVTLDGFDFSLDGGWGVVIEGNNATISNSNFVVGANGNAPVVGMRSSGDVTIRSSTIDGRDSPSVGGLVEMRGSGILTVFHSRLANSGGDIVQMHNSGAAALVLEYNLIENAGMSPGAHGDWTEFIGGPFMTTIIYNTAVQRGGSTQGFMVEPDIGSSPGVVRNGEIGNNTLIGSVSAFTGVTVADVVNAFMVHDNYFDPSSTLAGLAFSGPRGGPEDGSAKTFYINNTNMISGQVVCKNRQCRDIGARGASRD